MAPLKDVASTLSSAFKARNQKKLRKTNDVLLKAAVLQFNRKIYDLAVFSYVLSKIVSKPRYLAKDMDPYMKPIEKDLSLIAKNIDRYDDREWEMEFDELSDHIKKLESGDQRFLLGLMLKGKLKVAATMYAQGISLGLASEMTGIAKQDILDYAGKTMMFDRVREEKGILERMKFVRRVLKR